jgi:hypothetical protein
MDSASIKPQEVAFIDSHELAVVRQALAAMRDAVDLKAELGLPVLAETRDAILELESDILAIKLKVLRSHHPDQMTLPGMEHLGEGKHEDNDTSASCPAQLSNAPGS